MNRHVEWDAALAWWQHVVCAIETLVFALHSGWCVCCASSFGGGGGKRKIRKYTSLLQR